MTRYSIEPRNQVFVKGRKFFSFGKIMNRNADKNISENLNSK